MVNLAGIDLNLLVVLDALLTERNVTKAGARVGLSQPAASSALSRLRGLLDDPLLEKHGRHMRLTERACLLQAPLREALERLQGVIQSHGVFDPFTARFTVRIFASDQMTLVLLPLLRKRLAAFAPNAEIIFAWSDRTKTYELLADDKIDFAVGVYGDAPSEIKRECLFKDEIVVLARKDHPAFKPQLTLSNFLRHPRVVVSFEGTLASYIETALKRAGIDSRGHIAVAHVLAAPLVTWQNELLSIIPVRAAKRLSEMMAFDWRPAPFEIDALNIELLWHAKSEADPGLNWVRSQLIDVARLT